MPLREWTMTDNATYHKDRDKIDAIIITALANGPRRSYELIALLRAAGYGNAINDSPLELAYSMTGAIYRSAKNSLRERRIIYDGWDDYHFTGVKKDVNLIYRSDLLKTEEPAPAKEAASA